MATRSQEEESQAGHRGTGPADPGLGPALVQVCQGPAVQPGRPGVGGAGAGRRPGNGCPASAEEGAGGEEGAGSGVEGGVTQAVEADGEEGPSEEVEGGGQEEGVLLGVGGEGFPNLVADSADSGVDLGKLQAAHDGARGLGGEEKGRGEGRTPSADRRQGDKAQVGVAVGGWAAGLARGAGGGEGEEEGGEEEQAQAPEEGRRASPGEPEEEQGQPRPQGEPGPGIGTQGEEQAGELGEEGRGEPAFGVATDGFPQEHETPAERGDEEGAIGEAAGQALSKAPPMGKGEEEEEAGQDETALLGPEGEEAGEEAPGPNPLPAFQGPLLEEDGQENEEGRVGVHPAHHPADRLGVQGVEGPEGDGGQRAPGGQEAAGQGQQEQGVEPVHQGVHQKGEEGLVPSDQGVQVDGEGDQGPVEEGHPLHAILRPHEVGEDVSKILDVGEGDVVVASKLRARGPVPEKNGEEEPKGGEQPGRGRDPQGFRWIPVAAGHRQMLTPRMVPSKTMRSPIRAWVGNWETRVPRRPTWARKITR